MTIRELSELTGVTIRQIRFLIAEGFVPSPTGGRAKAAYGDEHVAAITRYMALRENGMPPAAIRILLENDAKAPFPVIPGMSLHIDPSLLGGEIDEELVIKRIREVLKSIVKEPQYASRTRLDTDRSTDDNSSRAGAHAKPDAASDDEL